MRRITAVVDVAFTRDREERGSPYCRGRNGVGWVGAGERLGSVDREVVGDVEGEAVGAGLPLARGASGRRRRTRRPRAPPPDSETCAGSAFHLSAPLPPFTANSVPAAR